VRGKVDSNWVRKIFNCLCSLFYIYKQRYRLVLVPIVCFLNHSNNLLTLVNKEIFFSETEKYLLLPRLGYLGQDLTICQRAKILNQPKTK
jgi:hypothetical protein